MLADRKTPKDILDFYDQSISFDHRSEQHLYSFSSLIEYTLMNFGDLNWCDFWLKDKKIEWSYTDMASTAMEVARQLKSQGIKDGDKVAILSESRPEFLAHFLGIGLLGACLVPVDPKLSLPEMANLLSHSETHVLLYSPTFSSIAVSLSPNLKSTKVFLSKPIEAISIAVLLTQLNSEWKVLRDIKNPLILIYTSGTSGAPKGVLLSVDNVLFGMQSGYRAFPPSRRPTHYLSILPLNHVFELVCGCLKPYANGARVTYVDSVQSPQTFELLKSHGIETVLSVPVFVSLIRKRVIREIEKSPKLKKLWKFLGQCQKYSLPMGLRRWLATPIRKSFAPDLYCFSVGGAPADLETQHFFDRLGIFIFQGYGLSETAASTTLTPSFKHREGASGLAMPGVEIKIDKSSKSGDGEICIRGRSVMLGYFKRPDLTSEVLTEDGWFKTGDLGALDSDGFLWVKGRLRNLIVLANGKKIVPEEVEDWFGIQEEVAESCVLLHNSKLTVVITPKESWWKSELSASEGELSEKLKNLLRGRAAVNLASFKTPTHFIIQKSPLPKTTTLKVKRHDVKKLIDQGV